MTSTCDNSGERCKTEDDGQNQNTSVDGSLEDSKTTNSLLVEDISMDKDDHSAEKVQENVAATKDVPTEVITKVYGPIAEVGLVRDLAPAETAKNSNIPTDSNSFCRQEDNVVNIQPADNMTINIQQSHSAPSLIQLAPHPITLSELTSNMVRNIQPTESAVQDYQPAENAIFRSQPQDCTTLNPERPGIIQFFSQPVKNAFPSQQPVENPGVFVRPAEGTLVYGCRAAAMYGCQIYGQKNEPTGSRSFTLSTTDAAGSDAGGTLNSQVHQADDPYATRYGQVSQNQSSQRSLLTQPTVHGFHTDQYGSDLMCSNTDRIRSDDSSERNTMRCGSRDPRKSRSLLYARRAESRDDDSGDIEAKKLRLELMPQFDSRPNYRGETI